jgi:hypothetical protein
MRTWSLHSRGRVVSYLFPQNKLGTHGKLNIFPQREVKFDCYGFTCIQNMALSFTRQSSSQASEQQIRNRVKGRLNNERAKILVALN